MDRHASHFSKTKNEERDAIILLSDMVNYSGHIEGMSLSEIRNYMYDYHLKIRKIIGSDKKKRHIFEPTAGDGTVAIFGCTSPQDKKELAEIAVEAAIRLSRAVTEDKLPPSRIGLFSGKMIEAIFDSHVLRFTPAFAAARRLEKLCDYFQCSFLMGKDIAELQQKYSKNVVSIGKITPRNFNHPIHICTIYESGLHNCPFSINQKGLQQFISVKNEAVNHFFGNKKQNTTPNFSQARKMLIEADRLFFQLTGSIDIATKKLLKYIDKNPQPCENFVTKGMRITLARHVSPDMRELELPQILLRALDRKLYDNMEKLQQQEKNFDILWFNAGDTILAKGDQPNGIYFIASGSVRVEDPEKGVLTRLETGELFGEAAYFTKEQLRTASIIAEQDVVLRRMRGEDLKKFPEIEQIFKSITQKLSHLPEII